MSNSIERFEQELRTKISNKSTSHQSEEGFLVKQFKFFDIYNTGVLSFDNFYRTVEKIGIIIDKEDVRDFYHQLHGVNQSGEINYREYAKNIYSSNKQSYEPAQTGVTYSPSKRAVFDDEEGGTSSYRIMRSGMNSEGYPLATTSQYYQPSTSAGRRSVMNPDYVNNQAMESLNQSLKNPKFDAAQESDYESSVHEEPPQTYNYGHEPEYYKHNLYAKKSAPKSQILYIERFKEELHNRGGRALIGLMRQFKLFDTDQSGYLDKYEFKKAVEDYEVNVHPKDLENLFNCFDTDRNGKIDYNEFIEALAGPMNKYRLQLVERAFDKLDRNGEGYIDMEEMLACYDAYRHPEVASGKNDPEGAFNDFKDSFEVYHNIIHDYNSSAKISRDEFTNFYTYISSQIEKDAHFDTLITGVWNLDNKNNYDEMPYAGAPQKITKIDAHSSWLNDHHRKMFGGDSDAITHPGGEYHWQTTHNSKYRTDIPAPKVTAGIPTWPVGATTGWHGGQMHEDQRMHNYEEAMSGYYNAPHHYSSGGNQY